MNIVDTVMLYVPGLERSGHTWKAPCPFHDEITPSLIVDPDRGTWHCFGGCDIGGDAQEFVRRMLTLTPEAR